MKNVNLSQGKIDVDTSDYFSAAVRNIYGNLQRTDERFHFSFDVKTEKMSFNFGDIMMVEWDLINNKVMNESLVFYLSGVMSGYNVRKGIESSSDGKV